MLRQPEALGDTGRSAPETASLPEWAFYIPALVASLTYALLPAGSLRTFVPFGVPLAVLAYAAYAKLIGSFAASANWHVVLAIAAICVTSCTSLLLNGGIVDYFTMRKFILPVSCLLIGLFGYRGSARGLLIFAVLLFLIAITNPESAANLDVPYLPETTSLGSTYSSTESVYAITFACLSIYLFARGHTVLGVLALLASVVLYKRFAAFSAVLAIAVYYAIPSRLSKSAAGRSWISVIIFASCAFISFHMTELLEFIADTFFPGTDIAELSSGRSLLYTELYDQIGNFDLLHYLFGNGPGAVERHLDGGAFLNGINLAHNEYLSIMFDFGILGLALSLAGIVALSRQDRIRFHTVVFVLILSLFENILLINVVLMTVVFMFAVVSRKDGSAHV